jgi:hypothetical protein
VVNLAISGVNSDNSLAGGRNFAFGGARARNDGAGVPDLAAQVAQFSASVGGVANPNALYLINVGGNDVFDILAGGSAPTIHQRRRGRDLDLGRHAAQHGRPEHHLRRRRRTSARRRRRTARRSRAAMRRSRSTAGSRPRCRRT